jgi:hypothetical protein
MFFALLVLSFEKRQKNSVSPTATDVNYTNDMDNIEIRLFSDCVEGYTYTFSNFTFVYTYTCIRVASFSDKVFDLYWKFNGFLAIALIILWLFKPELFYRRKREEGDPDVAGLDFNQREQRPRGGRRSRRTGTTNRNDEAPRNEERPDSSNQEVAEEEHMYDPEEREILMTPNHNMNSNYPYIPTYPEVHDGYKQEQTCSEVTPQINPYNPYDEGVVIVEEKGQKKEAQDTL